MESCIFCKIATHEIKADVVFETQNVLVFKDIHPCAPTHLLIIPKHHIQNIADSDDSHQEILGELLSTARKVSEMLEKPDFRLVSNNGIKANQSVFHLHVHFLADTDFTWPPGVSSWQS